MSIQRIRRDDTVIVMRGVSAGKTGKVLEVAGERALVEGVNLRKKTLRKSQDNPQGGIVEKESPIGLANLMPYCAHCKKGVRIARESADGKSVRKCRVCGHALDS